jgi:hypothetical protein
VKHTARLMEVPDALRPWHLTCSCGTAGTFRSEQDAINFSDLHARRRTGVDTYELIVTPKPPAVSAAPPSDGADAPPPPAVEKKTDGAEKGATGGKA